MNASKELQKYFDDIEKEVMNSFKSAEQARQKGFDPEPIVNIPLAKGVAQRVEGLISAVSPKIMKSGVAQRIIQLETKYGMLDWRVALKIAEEVAQEKFYKFDSKKEAIETGIRVGLAYITLGVISAPLEGFIELRIKKRMDRKEYFSAFFAGPIRAAGGTAEAVSIVIADYVRIKTGYSPYDPTEKEIKRSIAEIRDYHDRVTNLQYRPSDEELNFLLRHLPIEVNGDPTEELEVSNYKDLERIETNRIRGGICLVLAEGMAQKAPKVYKQLKKWGKSFGLEWEWLSEFLEIQKIAKAKGQKEKTQQKITPNYTYIKDLVAGRPVLSMPMKYGGFRLRYGRTRVTGLAASAIHPQTMHILNDYIATGTQLKIERPGKATAIVPCDTIDGPIIKLIDGSVLQLDGSQKVQTKDIDRILFLGDLLISYGDFSENNHKLVPVGYCEEWWIKEFEKKAVSLFGCLDFYKVSELLSMEPENLEIIFKDPITTKISARLAISISQIFDIPLHPKFTYYWTNINTDELIRLSRWILSAKEEKIVLLTKPEKDILEKIGLPHLLVNKEYIVIDKENSYILKTLLKNLKESPNSILEVIKEFSGITIRDKAGIFIGARMGRPEKSKMRKLLGSPHMLFPVGEEGGRLRSLQSCLSNGKINADFPIFYCLKCKSETIFSVCETCWQKTSKLFYCEKCGVTKKCPHDPKDYRKRSIDINEIFKKLMDKKNIRIFPDLIKGVKGTSNKDHVPEHLIKGVLRAKHGIYVNKDGTTRYDMIEVPITHFKPSEIGTSVEKLKELGYSKDIHGKKLESLSQVLELRPQDQILPAPLETSEEGADEVMFRVANFIDDLLVTLYDQEPYYNLKTKKDLIGQLVVGLAPHTSAGTVGRIIGFSKTQGMFCHPMFHAAMRRNCDGDEACIILLMDAFLNFSRSFLPDKRGSRTMDAPLVLTSMLVPGEVDSEVHGLDIVWQYPLELYEAAMDFKGTGEINITQISDVLNTPKQYEGMGYTHEVSDINSGVLCSAYKTIPSMKDKLMGQMDLAEKICAVEPGQVAQMVIEKHFLKDIKGNLRKFSTQQFRCVGCGEKYRRPPLSGKCTACKGKIIFTISEGSIIKYLEPTLSLARKYTVSKYLTQTLEFLEKQVESILGKEKEKQEGLGKWFG
ncbi:MAG: DNA polymerase II large subunit [archaeon]